MCIFHDKTAYGDVTVCAGEGQLLKGLDDALIGATVGEHTIVIAAEKAFGKKSAKLIQLVATTKFLNQGIKPYPGLQVNIDGTIGVIKNVSGGRTLVDFNHPLAGNDVTYDVVVHDIVTDTEKQVDALVRLSLGSTAEVVVKEKAATIQTRAPLPDSTTAQVKSIINELVPAIDSVQFSVKKAEEKKK
jgi:FKBP-type peptidyl-prolyl cis-trans isomerase 2